MSSSHSSAHPLLGDEIDLLGDEIDGDTPHPKSAVLVNAGELTDAAAAWRALTPLLAGRPIVRESTSGGSAYPRKGTRGLSERLPAVPAAVPIYSTGGDTRLLVVDLDTSKADRAAVLRDAAAVTELVRQCGGRLIADQSPSGGIHLYIPLARPVPFEEARDLALALAARTPTSDPQPMLGLTDGLIRPPGSRHRTGGFQRLRGSLAAAYGVLKQPNSNTVWTAMSVTLAAELAAVKADRTARDLGDLPAGFEPGFLPRKGGPRDLPADYLRIATTGLYNAGRYPTPSHARQAVLAAAVWAGMELPAVLGRLHGGAWPGLASFYARYRNPSARRKAVLGDWRNAVSWVQKTRANDAEVSHVRTSPTSRPVTHRATRTSLESQQQRSTAVEYQFLREWRTAVGLLELDRYRGRTGPAIRMVLRALGEAGMKAGSRYIEFGTRALDIASGLDHTTVAAHLRMLRDEVEPLVYLVEGDRGLRGDLYELRIPEPIAKRAGALDWRAGKVHGLRPVFRDLGLPAAFVYEALEHAKGRPTSFDLAAETAMARSTVYEALHTLAAFNLVEQRAGRWFIISTTSLIVLAESLGCADVIAARLEAHRAERAQYRRVLRVVQPLETGHTPGGAWTGPPEEGETALEVLERILGAQRIA